MKELKNPNWIKFKGLLFLIVGMFSAGLLILEAARKLETVVLVGIVIWCFCRFYYFAFYVIERYVDPGYRFSGLWSFVVYLMSKRRGGE